MALLGNVIDSEVVQVGNVRLQDEQGQVQRRAGTGRHQDVEGLAARVARAGDAALRLATVREADRCAEQLFARRYRPVMRVLAVEFPSWSEELRHDAVIDAVEEIRAGRRHASCTPEAERELLRRSRCRMIDRLRREVRRASIAPKVELHEELEAGREPTDGAIEAATTRGRLQELLLPLSEEERRWVVLTAGQGLSRDEGAARLGITRSRARRLVTRTRKHLVWFYASIADGSVHARFELRLRKLRESSATAEVLRDPQLHAHLAWCERCSELVRDCR